MKISVNYTSFFLVFKKEELIKLQTQVQKQSKLSPDIKAFKNICRVSMLENYAFMFHYLKQGTSIKKIAKYLARISHAAAIIETLTKNLPLSVTELTDNYGNYNYIIQRYKRGDNNAVINETHMGILRYYNEIPDVNNIEFLGKIYCIMINQKYGINEEMFCFNSKFNSKFKC